MDEKKDFQWLTDMDLEILEFMSCEFILSPTIIAENIGRSREGVSGRLSALRGAGLVSKLDRGKYRITSEGLNIWNIFDKEKYHRRRLTVREHKVIKYETGLSMKEYEDALHEEYERILEEQPDCDDPIEEAVEKLRSRLNVS